MAHGAPIDGGKTLAPRARAYAARVADFVIRRWDLAHVEVDQAPRHVHDASDEAFCVIAGRLAVEVDGVRRVLSAGEWATVPAGSAHTFATVDGPVRVLAVMTPEVDALVASLHEDRDPDERAADWRRARSRLV